MHKNVNTLINEYHRKYVEIKFKFEQKVNLYKGIRKSTDQKAIGIKNRKIEELFRRLLERS